MAANTSLVLTELDFNNLKESLKSSMKSQSIFKDYDFEGSSLNVLLDVLSYNSYLNAFYLNMIGSEMWMDSAQLRDSVVSHAKDLNYLPGSFISSEAVSDDIYVGVSLYIHIIITCYDSNIVADGFSNRLTVWTYLNVGSRFMIDVYPLSPLRVI